LFGNAGISSWVDETGAAMAVMDINEYRSLFHSIPLENLAEFEAALEAKLGLDLLADSPSLKSLPLWL
jgi:hypothetical protein